jgi:hypothetical protein
MAWGERAERTEYENDKKRRIYLEGGRIGLVGNVRV